MEWQQIVGFHHVARLRSFTKAAEATFRTQPALSHQIKALEKELGCRLFNRIAKRRLKLTPEGEIFYRFADLVLTEYECLRQELDERMGLGKGKLRIAAPFTTLYHLFPEKVGEYTRQFPQIELTLLDRHQDSVIELVRDGDVDFGFALESIIPKDLAALRWVKVATALMVPSGHPLTAIGRLTLSDLAAHPLILPPKNLKYTARATLEAQFQELGLDYRIVMESSNVELSSIYVEMGLGISLATTVAELPALRERKLAFLPMDHYFTPDHIALVMRKERTLASYKSAFVYVLLGKQGPGVVFESMNGV